MLSFKIKLQHISHYVKSCGMNFLLQEMLCHMTVNVMRSVMRLRKNIKLSMQN